jgi:peptidoglycan/LPS O-acetylase OafA/YrhL
MRGIAALCVMIYHYTQFGALPLLHHADLAVDVFFMLSGFVLTRTYAPRLLSDMSASDYIRRRLIRLTPMFLIGLLVGTLALYAFMIKGLSTYTPRALFGSFLCNAFYLPYINDLEIRNFVSTNMVQGEIFPANPPAWSLFFELIVSMAFIGLNKLGRSRLFKIAGLAFLALVVAGFLIMPLNHAFTLDLKQGWGTKNFLGGFPRVFYGFTVGMIIAGLAEDEKWVGKLARLKSYFGSTYVLYFLLILIFCFPKEFRGIYAVAVLLAVAPFLIFMASRIECHGLERKIASFLGWLSYGVYCLHYPIARAVFLIKIPFFEPFAIKMLVSLLLTLAAAIIVTRYCEEPVRVWLSRNARPALSYPDIKKKNSAEVIGGV